MKILKYLLDRANSRFVEHYFRFKGDLTKSRLLLLRNRGPRFYKVSIFLSKMSLPLRLKKIEARLKIILKIRHKAIILFPVNYFDVMHAI